MSEFVFERYAQTLSAGEVWRLVIAASELRIVSSSYPVSVELRRGGRVIGTASNMQAGDYVRGVDFESFAVTNGSTAQEVVIKLVSGQSGSDRITGEVSVISGELSRTLSGVAYAAGANVLAVAAQYGYVLLWNPAGSGRRLVVVEIAACTETTGVWNIRSVTSSMGAAYPIAPGNKLLGGVASVASIYTGTEPVLSGTPFTGFKANTTEYGKTGLNEPVIVPPGYGVGVWSSFTNEVVRASWQYWEEAV